MAQPAVQFQDVYAQVAQDLRQKLGDDLAAQAGPPASVPVTPVTDAKRLEAWNARHPEATDQAMMQLAAQKYAEHIQQGLPPDQAQQATAEDLTHFRYRARQPLYTLGTTSWAEQVKEAKRLARAAAKQAPAVGAGAAPAPEVTPAPSPELSALELGAPQSSGTGGTAPAEITPNGAAPTPPAPPSPPASGGY